MNDSKLNAGQLVYGAMSLMFSCIVAWPLYEQFGHWVCLAIPALCVMLILFRWAALGWVIAAATLMAILVLSQFTYQPLESGQRTWMGLSSLFLFASVFRFLATERTASEFVVTSRMNYTPINRVNSGNTLKVRSAPGIGHLLSIGVLFVAWLGARYLCGQFIKMAQDPAVYRQYARVLDNQLGLIPAGYIGISLILVLCLLLWIIREVIAYLQLLGSTKSVSGMLLRSELWKWNGREQRLISKQLRKNEV